MMTAQNVTHLYKNHNYNRAACRARLVNDNATTVWSQVDCPACVQMIEKARQEYAAE